jgi:hypothetical protein
MRRLIPFLGTVHLLRRISTSARIPYDICTARGFIKETLYLTTDMFDYLFHISDHITAVGFCFYFILTL